MLYASLLVHRTEFLSSHTRRSRFSLRPSRDVQLYHHLLHFSASNARDSSVLRILSGGQLEWEYLLFLGQ